ncbi:MAG: neutral/alkaline non-lysosomal ceramidase N-terminal domain-containing protein [Paenibacillaceae bacterium]|nr:neutral/alkaline non-lysosomal ceramidase N-terminal domain-containing protein [Paenibacillaceae bacterium]
MLVGIAKDLITPDRLTFMGGYGSFFDKPFQGIHDDLYVRALLLDDGRQPLLFVSLDLLFHDYALTETIQTYIGQTYGLPRDSLFLAYSHTHGGPAVRGYDDTSQHSAAYESFLQDRIRSCIDRVMVNRFEGTIAYGSVTGDWNINRRRQVDGAVLNMPNPEGVKDDCMHVLRVTDCNGKTRAILFNFACHPVTVRDAPFLSGDYPGRVCHLLEAEFFGGMGIFFQGAGGNSRPKATAKGGKFVAGSYEEMDDMAAAMTRSIVRLCRTPGALAPVEADFAVRQFTIELALEAFPQSVFAETIQASDGFPGIRKIAERSLQTYDAMPEEARLFAGLVRLSEHLYIACMGGEPCYEVKQKLEALLPGKTLLFFGYADATAYIPDDKIIAEGGYEAAESAVEYGLKGGFKPGIDKCMAEAFAAAYAEIGH